ncbi:MAG: Wzz/FepE/Etk N-terminal domain-containing protein, partial [Bacteroidota bacterium]
MNRSGNIFRLIRPFLKGWFIIGICMVLGGILGMVSLYYAVPEYQTVATLQINDKESGASAFLKNFEAFSITGQILTEVEVLRSRYLMEKTLKKLPLRVSFFQEVRGNLRELYTETPFQIDYTLVDSALMDRVFELEAFPDGELVLRVSLKGEMTSFRGRLGEIIGVPGMALRIVAKASDWQSMVGKPYAFRINSIQRMISFYGGHRLQVVLPDKEVSIVK